VPCDGCEGRSSRATSNCTTGRGLKRAWASRVCQCQVKGLLLYFAAGLGRRRCSGGGINSAVGMIMLTEGVLERDRQTETQTAAGTAMLEIALNSQVHRHTTRIRAIKNGISICRPWIGRVQRAVVMHGRV
jgi:hypothetical protein